MERICTWGREFVRSPYFDKLTEEQKKKSEFVIVSFSEHMYLTHGLPPEKWNEPALEDCCLNTLPAEMVAGELYFRSLSPVLSAFFQFLAEKRLVKRASVLAEKMRELDNQVVERALDLEYWNTEKRVFVAALEAGVTATDEEMDAFLDSFRKNPPASELLFRGVGTVERGRRK